MSENPIIDGLSHDQSSGSLLYKGVRYLLIRPETITGFQKAVTESFGQEAGEKLFAGGFTGGSLSSKKYRELHHFTDHEIVEFMMNMGNKIGWGCFNLEQYNPEKKYLCVSVTNSPFAESYGKSSVGVCHLIRGVLAGMASVVFNASCTSTEIECIAKGDPKCLFIVEADANIRRDT